MKSEIEFKWIVNLLNCPFIKKTFKTIGGCKKDFERVSGSGENNMEFRRWFDLLIEQGAIEEFGFCDSRGKRVMNYVIIYKKLEKILSKNEIYPSVIKVMDKKYVFRDINFV